MKLILSLLIFFNLINIFGQNKPINTSLKDFKGENSNLDINKINVLIFVNEIKCISCLEYLGNYFFSIQDENIEITFVANYSPSILQNKYNYNFITSLFPKKNHSILFEYDRLNNHAINNKLLFYKKYNIIKTPTLLIINNSTEYYFKYDEIFRRNNSKIKSKTKKKILKLLNI